MKNVISFPTIRLENGVYWHRGERFPTLETVDAFLTGRNRERVLAWQDCRQQWIDAQKKPSRKRGKSGSGGNAA